MTTEEIKQLEDLLFKLHAHIGTSFCIVHPTVHQAFHVGIYNERGDLASQSISMTLEDAINKALPPKEQ